MQGRKELHQATCGAFLFGGMYLLALEVFRRNELQNNNNGFDEKGGTIDGHMWDWVSYRGESKAEGA